MSGKLLKRLKEIGNKRMNECFITYYINKIAAPPTYTHPLLLNFVGIRECKLINLLIFHICFTSLVRIWLSFFLSHFEKLLMLEIFAGCLSHSFSR